MKQGFIEIVGILVLALILGCGKVGPTGPQGEPGESIQGPPGLPGPECAFFCKGKHTLYIRCDGHADIVVTGIGCSGEGD